MGDGNVLRVAARFTATQNAYSAEFKTTMLGDLKKRMNSKNASHFNQALMELGATVCMPKTVQCQICPLESNCAGRKKNPLDYPSVKSRKASIDVHSRSQIFFKNDPKKSMSVLLVRRQTGDWFSGLWDFPSELGSVGEPVRKFKKISGKKLGQIKHSITHHRITAEAWVAKDAGRMQEGKWISLDALFSENPPVPLATTAKKLLRIVVRHLDKKIGE